jgi:shikimate kinase
MEADRQIANLVITGFSGTGKSLMGKEVARRLNWDFLDTDDDMVKQAGKPIAEIFRQEGEGKFRKLERRTIRKACQQRQTVIAIGGGAIVEPQNYESLAKTGLIVCLEAKPETIYERLFREAACSPETEVRPLLATDNPLERIRQLKASRQPYYAKADWTIHTDGLSISEVAEEVMRAWRLLRRTHPHLNPLPSREMDFARICKACYIKGIETESLERMILEERIPPTFVTNSGRWSVAGIDNGFIRQNHKFFADTFHETFVAHSWKIGPANTKIE